MKVSELITLLQTQDPDRVVVLSIDAEGNGYSLVREVDTASFDENDAEIGIEELTEELEQLGYSESDIIGGVPALVMWP